MREMAGTAINQPWCGHGVSCSFSPSKPPHSKRTLKFPAAFSSSSSSLDPQSSSTAPTSKRFSHLSPLLSQLIASSSAEVPIVLEPWLPFLSADDWNVIIADIGPRSWSNSLQVFYTFKQKSSLWQDLLCENRAGDGNASSVLKVYTTVVRLLAKKHRTEEIAIIREQMKFEKILPDTSFYNSLFASYADQGHADEISKGLLHMETAGIKPNHLTYELLITACLCGEAPDLDMSERLLQSIIKEGGHVSANTFRKLINAFWEVEDVEGAERVFTSMQDAGYLPDLKVINKLMQLHGRSGNYKRNLELFNLLKNLGTTQTETAYTFLLHSYCKARLLTEAQEAFRNFQKVTGSKPSLVTFNIIMDACGKHGLYEEVLKHYGDLCNTGLEVNVVSYCSVISALVNVGKFKKAEQMYKRMLLKDIQPNLHIYLTMIQCYKKRKATRLGHELYVVMRKARIKMTDTAYSAVLALYVEGRWYDHAANLLTRIERMGFNLDTAANGLLIRAFSALNDDMTTFVQAVESSRFGICKLLKSLSLTLRKRPEERSLSLQTLIVDYLERMEAGSKAQSSPSIHNAFLDFCWQRGLKRTAQVILEEARQGYAANTRPKVELEEWTLDVRGLSIGGSKVAVAEWLHGLDKVDSEGLSSVDEANLRGAVDAKKMILITGLGDFPYVIASEEAVTHRKGLKGELLLLLHKLGSPFGEMSQNPTALEASVVDVLKWVRSGAVKKELSLVDCL